MLLWNLVLEFPQSLSPDHSQSLPVPGVVSDNGKLASRLSLPSASRSMMSNMSSWIFLPWRKEKKQDLNTLFIFISLVLMAWVYYVIPSDHLWISAGPIVSSTSAMLRQIDVLGVVQVCIRRVKNGVDHPWLQIQQNCTGDVVLIIGLLSWTDNDRSVADSALCSLMSPCRAKLLKLTLQSPHLVANSVVTQTRHPKQAMCRENTNRFSTKDERDNKV